MEKHAKNKELNIAILWKVFRARILWLVLALIIGMGAAFCYTQFIAVPTYSSTADFLVQNVGNSPSATQSSYLQGAEIIAKNYAQKISGNVFLEQVADVYNEQHGTNITYKDVRSKLNVTMISESSTIRVKITSTDPEVAYRLIEIMHGLVPEGLNDSEAYIEYLHVELIERGELDETPDSPNLALNLLLGGAVALVVTYVVFFLMAVLDRTVYSESELKEQFELPIVGQIPEWLREGESATARLHKMTFCREVVDGKSAYRIRRDYKNRLLSKDSPFWITEAFKTLRTNLTYATTGDTKSPIFGVTSDFTGAGKSLIAANLAISFAQLGKRVLLIDGDMRCPTQHRIFSVDKKQYGLSEALTGAAGDVVDHYVTTSKYEGLDLMVCGHIPPNPCELLASERMKRLLAEIALNYDYVLIDLPPICATTDAGVLALSVTGYILAVRAGYSNLNAVSDSIETMQAMHANLIGFVLNAVPPKSGARYGSYKNGYGNYGAYSRYGRYARYGLAAADRVIHDSASETDASTNT